MPLPKFPPKFPPPPPAELVEALQQKIGEAEELIRKLADALKPKGPKGKD